MLFDGLKIGHGGYLISGEGDILSDHDKDLNKTFTDKFSFSNGHTIKMMVDLSEQQIIFNNLTNKKSFTLNIKIDPE